MGAFPYDYPIASLRGAPQVPPGQIRRSMRARIHWLDAKIAERRVTGLPVSMFVEELAAVVALLDRAGVDLVSVIGDAS
jgi:hypothetical protein